MENFDKAMQSSLTELTNPKGSYIPIIASSLVTDINTLISPLGSSVVDYTQYEAALDTFKDCGFNGFIAQINADPGTSANPSYKRLQAILNKAAAKGMFVIVNNDIYNVPNSSWFAKMKNLTASMTSTDQKIEAYKDNFEKPIKSFITECAKTDGFGGILLYDEPSTSQLTKKLDSDNAKIIGSFNNSEGLYYSLSNRYNIVDSALAGSANAVLMLNLIGEPNAVQVIEEGHTFSDYLDAFANIKNDPAGTEENVHSVPYLWSYDIYPITEMNYLLALNFQMAMNRPTSAIKLSDNGNLIIKYTDFYRDLELFSERAKNGNGVYWSYFQSMTYLAGTWLRPLALEQYLRFSIFSSLAMGCQGIMYWTYHQRRSQELELYLSAPVNMEDRKTAIWYYAKRINAEIRKFNNVFRHCKLINWGHVGTTYDGCKVVGDTFECFEGFNSPGDYDNDFLITYIVNGEKKYIVIVSHRIQEYQRICLRFDSGRFSVKHLTGAQPLNVEPVPHLPASKITDTLAPGGYIIFEWDHVIPQAVGDAR